MALYPEKQITNYFLSLDQASASILFYCNASLLVLCQRFLNQRDYASHMHGPIHPSKLGCSSSRQGWASCASITDPQTSKQNTTLPRIRATSNRLLDIVVCGHISVLQLRCATCTAGKSLKRSYQKENLLAACRERWGSRNHQPVSLGLRNLKSFPANAAILNQSETQWRTSHQTSFFMMSVFVWKKIDLQSPLKPRMLKLNSNSKTLFCLFRWNWHSSTHGKRLLPSQHHPSQKAGGYSVSWCLQESSVENHGLGYRKPS